MIDIKRSLIEWSEKQGLWAKYLLAKCFEHSQITDNDLDVLILHALTDDLENVQNFSLTTLPSSKITLKSLQNVTGVNKLAPNQRLNFNDNLTVVFGTNGSGKTGYVRVLKQIGTSLDKNSEILDNLDTDDHNDFGAQITFKNSKNEESTIELSRNNNIKLNVKIFNHDCVVFSLKDKKEMLFNPREFEYFNILSSGISVLTEKIKTKQKEYFSNLTLTGIISGTKVENAVNDIIVHGKTTILEKLNEDYKNTADFDIQIAKCEAEIQKLNVSNLKLELKNTLLTKSELNDYLINFTTKSGIYNASFWREILDLNDEQKKLEAETIDIDSLIKITNSNADKQNKLKNLLLSVNSYLAEYSQSFNSTKTCPLCQQSINEATTKSLFNSYQKFIEKDNSSLISTIKTKLTKKQKLIEDEIIVIEKVLTKLSVLDYKETAITFLKDLLKTINLSNLSDILDFSEIINSLKNEILTLEEKQKKIEVLISSNDKEITKLLNEINEIKSLKILINNFDVISTSALNIFNLNKLTNLNTSSLSSLQRKILVTNYQESFITNLSRYLTILRAPTNISFEPKISASSISLKQQYATHSNDLNQILSEGEQTVVALAHFVAENIIQDDDNVLIFDDPVNSLDIDRMDIVAKALVNLSFNKQIIIFTHNLVFLNSINRHVKQLAQRNSSFYHLDRTSTQTGFLVEGLPNTQTYKYYRNQANDIYQKALNANVGEIAIKQGYSFIRSAIEILVVDYVFNGTVKRFESAIHMGNFERIKVNDFNSNYANIVALFDKCCEYTEAHSSSEHGSVQPTKELFIEDFKELERLFNIFKTNG